MTDLKSRIQSAKEFDEQAFRTWRSQYGYSADPCAKHQHAQTQWAFEALLKAVNALEIIKDNAEIAGINVDTRVSMLGLEQIAALVPKGE